MNFIESVLPSYLFAPVKNLFQFTTFIFITFQFIHFSSELSITFLAFMQLFFQDSNLNSRGGIHLTEIILLFFGSLVVFSGVRLIQFSNTLHHFILLFALCFSFFSFLHCCLFICAVEMISTHCIGHYLQFFSRSPGVNALVSFLN